MRSFLAGIALVAVLVAAGCGGGGSPSTTGSTAPRHASNGEASKPAKQVLADAVKSAKGASYMRMHGNVSSSGKKIGLDLYVAKGTGVKGILTFNGVPVGLMVIGKDGYLKAHADFWKQFAGSNGAAIGQLLDNKWLKFPVDNAQFAPLVAFASPNSVFDQLKSGADSSLKNNGVTTYNGQSVVALDDGANNGTLYVAASGIPYPVALVKKGSGGGTISFSGWDHPFTLTAPTDVIDVSQLPGM